MRGLKLPCPIKELVTKVASFTDAWIETSLYEVQAHGKYVASFTDAWIETAKELEESLIDLSHLLQMRGLKHRKRIPFVRYIWSHLLQMRGLKQVGVSSNL